MSKKNEVINVRVDSDIKSDSKIVLEKHDISHSKAFRMLLDYLIKYDDIPDFMKKSK